MSALSENLYEKDLSAWVNQQIEILKSGRLEKIDVKNLIEELESVGVTERRTMESYFEVLICHMLKWKYQPTHRSKSWINSINNSISGINKILKYNPSLKNFMQKAFDEAWESGRKQALKETKLNSHEIPNKKVWTVETIMAVDIDPDEIVQHKWK